MILYDAISFQVSKAERPLQLQAKGMKYDASLYYAENAIAVFKIM